MNVVKLAKNGRVSIPRSASRALGIEDEQMKTVEVSDDAAIVLRPAGVYPFEAYDDARIAEFLAEDEVPADLRDRLDANVLFTTAISPDGASRALVRASATGACRLAASPFAIDEAQSDVPAWAGRYVVDDAP